MPNGAEHRPKSDIELKNKEWVTFDIPAGVCKSEILPLLHGYIEFIVPDDSEWDKKHFSMWELCFGTNLNDFLDATDKHLVSGKKFKLTIEEMPT